MEIIADCTESESLGKKEHKICSPAWILVFMALCISVFFSHFMKTCVIIH